MRKCVCNMTHVQAGSYIILVHMHTHASISFDTSMPAQRTRDFQPQPRLLPVYNSPGHVITHCMASSDALMLEVQALSLGRIAEEYIESPHRAVRRERARATASQISWISATANLPHNLVRNHALCREPGGVDDFTRAWRRFKSVIRPPGAPRCKQNRPVKITTKKFRHRIYQLFDQGYSDFLLWPVRPTRQTSVATMSDVPLNT